MFIPPKREKGGSDLRSTCCKMWPYGCVFLVYSVQDQEKMRPGTNGRFYCHCYYYFL